MSTRNWDSGREGGCRRVLMTVIIAAGVLASVIASTAQAWAYLGLLNHHGP